MRKIIAICGDAFIEEGGIKEKIAYELGKTLIDNGYRIQCGGMDGVMRAVCRGAHDSKSYSDGDVIGILPSFDRTQVNEFVDIAIPTGLDIMRNVLVANADAVIAVGGGAGTLSEVASAWTMKKLVLAFENVDGWSRKIANTKLDGKIRYTDLPFEDIIFGVSSAEEAIRVLKEKIGFYNRPHSPLYMKKK